MVIKTDRRVLTGPLDNDAKMLAAINVLKEQQRRRFVEVVGDPRRDAYKGIVHATKR